MSAAHLGVVESTEDVSLLCQEAGGGEHRGPAVARDDAYGEAALPAEVGVAAEEEEHNLVHARPQLRHRAPAPHHPHAAALASGAIIGLLKGTD